jgi:hypothetical protein
LAIQIRKSFRIYNTDQQISFAEKYENGKIKAKKYKGEKDAKYENGKIKAKKYKGEKDATGVNIYVRARREKPI